VRGSALVVPILVCLGTACHRVDADSSRRHAGERRNLLLVSVDTLRADRVGAYGAGDVETPALDSLARDGTRFATAIAPTPLTLPSHASLFTGLYPARHGVRHNGLYRLDGEVETLAERLRESGYATAAVVGAAVLDADYGLAQGFELYDDEVSSSDSGSAVTGYVERRAGAVTERALAWLGEAREPFFLWVHYYDPHALYRPPPPFDERFRERPYDGEVAYVDTQLGRLLTGLRTKGREGRTLVVATSDHGESLGEHREPTHGYTLYDVALRVPLILKGPGVPDGRVVNQLTSLVDVAPTLLALLGLEAWEGMEGRNLTLAWREPTLLPERMVYAETLATQLDHGWSPLHAIRSLRYLYIRAPRPELYDVRTDPHQRHNLYASAGVDLAREVRSFEARLASLHTADERPTPLAIEAAERERLRALGYDLASAPATYTGLDPKDGLVSLERYAKAARAFARGELEEALALAEAALGDMPQSARLHGLLAGIQVRSGRSDRALAHAQSAARLVPEAVEYRQLLGDVRYNVGDLAGAIDAYREASELAPSSAFVHERLAWFRAQAEGSSPELKASRPGDGGRR
jgi:arylsulfatase A-like enzyme